MFTAGGGRQRKVVAGVLFLLSGFFLLFKTTAVIQRAAAQLSDVTLLAIGCLIMFYTNVFGSITLVQGALGVDDDLGAGISG